jgi:hypothetical protein
VELSNTKDGGWMTGGWRVDGGWMVDGCSFVLVRSFVWRMELWSMVYVT